MNRITFLLIISLTACSQAHHNTGFGANLNWIDLGYSLDSSTLYWPNNVKGFEHYKEADGETALGYYYSSGYS
jgi:hypothetical protein